MEFNSSLTAALTTDGYKTFHGSAIHEDIERMYGNFTNRTGRLSNLPDNRLNGVLSVGLKSVVTDLECNWDATFFNVDIEDIIPRMKSILDSYLGIDYDMTHYKELHCLGYLPLLIKGVPEGTIVPYGVAPYTVQTTVDGYEWLALYIETVLSCETWHMNTTATTAAYFYMQAKEALKKADLDETMLPFMCHDFSMRGMTGVQTAAKSGYAHLAAGHAGTDTLPALFHAMDYYGADMTNELVGCSVKATEHSITTSYIMTYAQEHDCSIFEAEVAYARKLLAENPTGILSYVADSFDFWRFVTEGLDLLKEDIMARDGTFVIRPDSGDPVDVLCGTTEPEFCGDRGLSPEQKGLVQILAEKFGTTDNGTVRSLDSHIGAIYGDSITVQRQKQIYDKLIAKKLSPVVVLGVGSYSYQMVTRDTHGSAVKCTAAFLKDGSVVDVCKDPKTDSNKKSAKGLLFVGRDTGGEVFQNDQVPHTTESETGNYKGGKTKGDIYQVYLENGKVLAKDTLQSTRELVAEQINKIIGK